MVKYAVLGYNTINIGDDIQSFITSTLLDIDYIVMRDDFEQVYDYTTGEECILNEQIYLIMNGWFMHNSVWQTGNDDIKFPINNKNIIPIYISTCLSKDVPLLYKPECIEHYKKFSPILCRDLTTFKLLKERNVDVEFYGCVTQLLDIEKVSDNENHKEMYKDSVIYIDCKPLYNNRDKNEKAFYFEHYIDEILNMNVKKRIEYAKDILTKYKYAKKIYSHRLHAFLPCRAMGLNVEYVGDLNYRVKDVVSIIPNKNELKKKFYEYINNKLK